MGIFSFLKKKDKAAASQPAADPVSSAEAVSSPDLEVPGDQIATSEPLNTRLKKSRSRFAGGLLDFLGGRTGVDEALLDDLEAQLIMSDIGVATTDRIIAAVRQSARNSKEPDLQEILRQQLIEILQPCEQSLQIPEMSTPFVLLIVGVNGAGKTTTIGKIARQLQNGDKSVLLAAGDTFRAAAVEQLQTWGQRNNIPVVAQGTGADSASVIFDAVQSAKAKGVEVVIADTAGRLHTQAGLMDELAKVARVIKKFDDTAPHETLLVLDGTTGQNGLNQAREFSAKVNVTGLVVTKLDGSAKGGMLFTLADELKLPIRFIGVGEGIYDLRVFEAGDFVDALLGDTSPDGSIHSG